MTKDEFATVAKSCLRRIFRGNFQLEQATDAEREFLSNAPKPVKDPIAQDYAAWRRAVLYVGALLLCIWAAVELVSYETAEDGLKGQNQEQLVRAIGKDNLDLLDTITMVLTLAVIVGAIFMVLAARSWYRIRASRRLARIAFYVIFVTPFVMAAIPFTSLMDFDHLAAADRKSVGLALGSMLGFSFFLIIGPRALALYPAVIRSSVTLKTLIPESPLPGWATVLMAPLYPVFLIVVLAMINQIGGNFLIVAGMICLIIAPMVYLRRAKDILSSYPPDQVKTLVAGARTKAMVWNTIGVVLLAIYILDLDIFGFWDCVRFLIGFLGNFLLVTLVGADLLLALMHAGHRQTIEFGGSDLAKDLDRKFEGLSDVGFTDIKAPKVEARRDTASD